MPKTKSKKWMVSPPPPPPFEEKKKTPVPPPMPPTLRSLYTAAAQGAAGVVNYVSQVEGNTARNIGQVASRGAVSAARGLESIGNAEKMATAPIRKAGAEAALKARQVEKGIIGNMGQVAGKSAALGARTLENIGNAEREASWAALQGGNYFFGLPYTTQTYAEYIKQKGAVPAPVTPVMGPIQGPMPIAQPAEPDVPYVLTQAQINQAWIDHWNNKGPRPASDLLFQP